MKNLEHQSAAHVGVKLKEAPPLNLDVLDLAKCLIHHKTVRLFQHLTVSFNASSSVHVFFVFSDNDSLPYLERNFLRAMHNFIRHMVEKDISYLHLTLSLI